MEFSSRRYLINQRDEFELIELDRDNLKYILGMIPGGKADILFS